MLHHNIFEISQINFEISNYYELNNNKTTYINNI